MKYIKLFDNFSFDELLMLGDIEKAILHIILIHEKTYYNDTKISDEFMFKNDIKELIQMGINKSKIKLNPRRYPHNPNLSNGLLVDHILATLSDYQLGIYDDDKFGINNEDIDTSLRLELDFLLEPLKKREDGIIDENSFLIDMKDAIKSAMNIDKNSVYQRAYKD